VNSPPMYVKSTHCSFVFISFFIAQVGGEWDRTLRFLAFPY
jgi:hypothetical protein